MMCEGVTFALLGTKIRNERKRMKLTQAALSDGIVTRNMLSRIENGDAVPSLATLILLSERLNVSASYLLDDSDDGTEHKHRRLLTMARNEYREGNYEACLHFAECVASQNEERDRLIACAEYSLAIEELNHGTLYQAQVHLVAALKNESYLTHRMVAEGRIYRALIDSFIYTPHSGQEEALFFDVLKFALAPTDFTVFLSVLTLVRSKQLSAASELMSTVVFSTPYYSHLLKGLIAWENNDLVNAKRHIIEATGFPMISPIRAYSLTLLEKISVLLGDFENAYAYMNSRRELLEELLRK